MEDVRREDVLYRLVLVLDLLHGLGARDVVGRGRRRPICTSPPTIGIGTRPQTLSSKVEVLRTVVVVGKRIVELLHEGLAPPSLHVHPLHQRACESKERERESGIDESWVGINCVKKWATYVAWVFLTPDTSTLLTIWKRLMTSLMVGRMLGLRNKMNSRRSSSTELLLIMAFFSALMSS